MPPALHDARPHACNLKPPIIEIPASTAAKLSTGVKRSRVARGQHDPPFAASIVGRVGGKREIVLRPARHACVVAAEASRRHDAPREPLRARAVRECALRQGTPLARSDARLRVSKPKRT
ncbi:hypothetical protein [Burkholderia sp. PU8-34]